MLMVIISYIAIVIFLIGTFYKIWFFSKVPSPLKIPVTPAPTSALGVAGRFANEIVFFRSLFKGNKWIWLGGYMFHALLFLVLFRHLRYFFEPVPDTVLLIQQIGIYAGLVLAVPIIFLMVRRFLVDRVRYISAFSDFFILFLLLGIALSGVWLKFMSRVNIVEVKLFVLGLFSFSPHAFPDNNVFLIHFSLVLLLLIYFPFSKLLHAVGIFFSPSFSQIDNTREKRHSIED